VVVTGVAGSRVGLDLDVLVLQFGGDGWFGGHQLDSDGGLLVGAGADVDDRDLLVQDDDEGLWWWPGGRDRCLSQGFPVDDQFLAAHRDLEVACTTTLLGTYAAIALQGVLGIHLSDDGGAEAALVALVALLGYTFVSLVAITTAAYLERRPATVQAVLPGADALGFEVATLLLGVVTAAFVLGSPWLLPAVFVLVAVLHRSTLVNELEGAARTDTKTGLLTADAWHSLADQHLLRAERQGTPVAVLMIDLDHFKRVNDRFGHLAGDRTLKAVAVCLKDELRGYDAVGRFGGEEFIALLDGAATETATNTAVRITQAIRALTPSPPTTAAHSQSPHPSG